jgi:hypothetical protein
MKRSIGGHRWRNSFDQYCDGDCWGQCWSEKVVVVDTCAWSGQCWGEEGDRGGHMIRTVLRRGRWSWRTPLPDQDNTEMRKVNVVDTSTWSGQCWGEDTCTWSGECWGEGGDRGGHLYLIRTVLGRGRWSWWTPVLDQDSAETRMVIMVDMVPDQDSAEGKKVNVVDTCTLSGQCWGGKGDGGGHPHLIRTVLTRGGWSWWNLYLIRTVLRRGRWSWWTPVLDQDSAEMRKVIVVDTWTAYQEICVINSVVFPLRFAV